MSAWRISDPKLVLEELYARIQQRAIERDRCAHVAAMKRLEAAALAQVEYRDGGWYWTCTDPICVSPSPRYSDEDDARDHLMVHWVSVHGDEALPPQATVFGVRSGLQFKS